MNEKDEVLYEMQITIKKLEEKYCSFEKIISEVQEAQKIMSLDKSNHRDRDSEYCKQIRDFDKKIEALKLDFHYSLRNTNSAAAERHQSLAYQNIQTISNVQKIGESLKEYARSDKLISLANEHKRTLEDM
jgi:hypothetical protein